MQFIYSISFFPGDDFILHSKKQNYTAFVEVSNLRVILKFSLPLYSVI